MKPYVVNGYSSGHVYDFGGPREARYTYYADSRSPNANASPTSFDGMVLTYFCDSEEAATQLAKYMASKHANTHWMVSKVDYVFQSTPGPVKAGRLSDKGFLPV